MGQDDRIARIVQLLLDRDPTLDLRPGSVGRGVIELMLQTAGDGDYSFLTSFDNMQRAAQLSRSNPFSALFQAVGQVSQFTEELTRPVSQLMEVVRNLIPVQPMPLPEGIRGEEFAEQLVEAYRAEQQLSDGDTTELSGRLRELWRGEMDVTEVFTRTPVVGFTNLLGINSLDNMTKVAATPRSLPDWCRVGQLVRRRTDGSVVRVVAIERDRVSFAMAAHSDVLTHRRFTDPPFEEEYTLVQPKTRWELLDEED